MKAKYSAAFLFFSLALFNFSFKGYSQKGLPPDKQTHATVNTHFPKVEEFKKEQLKTLKVEDRFKVSIAASGLGKPRMMAIDKNKNLYVTRRDQGDVLLLTDADKNGTFDELKPVVTKFKGVHGIAIYDGYLYLASNRELKRGKIGESGEIAKLELLADDLPDGGQHGNRTIAFGPDGKLYITVGSTCNDCNETNKESATILVANADGSGRKIFARGLRNTIGIDWHPQTGELWGADNGTDWRGDNIPPEEINKITEGKDYGWPLVYGKQQVDETREDPMGATKDEYAKTTEPSILELPAHSAPINFVFMNKISSIPAAMRDDALVTLHGSWNREEPDGYKVVRVIFEDGNPTRYEDFLSGFLRDGGASRVGRPAGIAIAPDGTIFLSDDGNGSIYSVTYEGTASAKN